MTEMTINIYSIVIDDDGDVQRFVSCDESDLYQRVWRTWLGQKVRDKTIGLNLEVHDLTDKGMYKDAFDLFVTQAYEGDIFFRAYKFVENVTLTPKKEYEVEIWNSEIDAM